MGRMATQDCRLVQFQSKWPNNTKVGVHLGCARPTGVTVAAGTSSADRTRPAACPAARGARRRWPHPSGPTFRHGRGIRCGRTGRQKDACPNWTGCSSSAAELATIDENLCRNELSPAERAGAVARRKTLYESMHPETAYEARPGRAGKCRHDGDNSPPADRFTKATAAATGRSERSVQRTVRRGEFCQGRPRRPADCPFAMATKCSICLKRISPPGVIASTAPSPRTRYGKPA